MDIISGSTAGLSGLKTASELTTSIRDRLKRNDIQLDEVTSRIVEILDLIHNGQTALINATQDAAEITAELKRMKDSTELKKRRTAHDSAYWVVDADGTEIGPYCPTCWDLTDKLVRPIFCYEIPDLNAVLLACAANHTNIHIRIPKGMCSFYHLGEGTTRQSSRRNYRTNPW